MGKILIIKGIDYSSVSVDKVTLTPSNIIFSYNDKINNGESYDTVYHYRFWFDISNLENDKIYLLNVSLSMTLPETAYANLASASTCAIRLVSNTTVYNGTNIYNTKNAVDNINVTFTMNSNMPYLYVYFDSSKISTKTAISDDYTFEITIEMIE